MTRLTRPAMWLVAVLGAAVVPSAAAAQPDGGDAVRVAVSAGAGVAVPFHADFDFTAGAWEAALRLGVSRHVMVEIAVGDWRHSTTTVSTNVSVSGGAIGRLERRTTRVQRSVQAGVLFTGSAGRISFSGGGGAGFVQHYRDTTRRAEQCTGVEDACDPFVSTFSSLSIGAEGMGGVDVRLASHLGAYGQIRIIVPVIDPGSGDLRVTTGIRVFF